MTTGAGSRMPPRAPSPSVVPPHRIQPAPSGSQGQGGKEAPDPRCAGVRLRLCPAEEGCHFLSPVNASPGRPRGVALASLHLSSVGSASALSGGGGVATARPSSGRRRWPPPTHLGHHGSICTDPSSPAAPDVLDTAITEGPRRCCAPHLAGWGARQIRSEADTEVRGRFLARAACRPPALGCRHHRRARAAGQGSRRCRAP
ncbi:hypothetical protein E2562_022193 [Oryza meyeriana var. granulata]|uniref:Uncharacterized protein n=1 Tax=Oryza meyeriana var. granulata TaxID=110450 RepID=A0A6G1DLW8_9ORYZ|nr:hypothetical protein E2562_022193 [Oryza meyeriana var. granulata]